VIRTLWMLLVGWVVTIPLSIDVIVAERLRLHRYLARICPRNQRWWARSVLWASGVKVEFEGLDRLAGSGPRVVVANHESWFDVIALVGHLPWAYKFVAKQELARVPFWGRAFQACGHILVDRANRQSAPQAIERARKARDDNALIILFPEGTRSPDGTLLPFKKGAFVLALQLGAPLIPVALIGGRHILGKGRWDVRPGTLRVVVGEPMSTAGLEHGDRDDLLRRSRAAVVALRGGEGPTDARAPRPNPAVDSPAGA
jgi:1-acyl-sn-glycerol-3-phosphate acyltransferase